MNTLHTFILTLAIATGIVCAQPPAAPAGADAAAQIVGLQAPLQAVAAETEKFLATAQTWYLSNLDQIQSERAKAGDLDAVILVKAERERVTAKQPPTEEQLKAMSPAVRKLRVSYDAALKNITDDEVKRNAAAKRKYLADLEALQTSITKTGNIEQALVVKAEKDRIAAEIAADNAAAAAAKPVVQQPAKPTPQPKVATSQPKVAAPADSVSTSVKALVAGSRWQWFASPDLSGKAYWGEFYKDGKARTSWGQGHTWDIIPPNILHIFQPSDNRQWYFEIDVAKRVGLKNAERDRNNDSIRYEKRVSTPPANAKNK